MTTPAIDFAPDHHGSRRGRPRRCRIQSVLGPVEGAMTGPPSTFLCQPHVEYTFSSQSVVQRELLHRLLDNLDESLLRVLVSAFQGELSHRDPSAEALWCEAAQRNDEAAWEWLASEWDEYSEGLGFGDLEFLVDRTREWSAGYRSVVAALTGVASLGRAHANLRQAAASALLGAVQHPESEVQVVAINCLGHLGDPLVRQPLASLAKRADGPVRRAAERAVRRLGGA